jgi:membrane-bound serine protease (ClpP class)
VKLRNKLIALSFGFGLMLAAAMNASAPGATPPASMPPQVSLITIDGPINPASAGFIIDSIDRANQRHQAALVIELDTPGGLLSSAREIVKALLNSPVPVIVYVAPAGASAASAGTFVTQAANIAAMAPGTTIGAAHPVTMSGGDISGDEGAKIENYTVSFARAIASQRGRNENWVEDAVRKSSAIGAAEALKLHVIDAVAPDLHSLLAQASGRQVIVAGGRAVKLDFTNAIVRRREMRLGESLLNRLADPNLMYLLMIAGMAGLYFEFAHPGAYLPGVAGAICLLLALASFEVIPINFAGLALITLGAGMLISEMFVTSYGVLGIGGVTAFVIGSLFLVDTSRTNLEVSHAIIAGAAGGFSAIVLGVGYIVMREGRGRASTGREGLIGEIGEVREAITPGTPGRIFVHGEIWRAVSDSRLAPGAHARVMAVNGLEVVVRPAGSDG